MLRRALAPEVDADEFNRIMRECDREADEISMGRGTDVGFAERVELTLRELGGDGVARTSTSGVSESDVTELMARQAELARAHHPLPLDERLPDLVAELAETRPVVLTSNTGMLPGVLMRDLLALAGFHGKLGMVFQRGRLGQTRPADLRDRDHTRRGTAGNRSRHPALYTSVTTRLPTSKGPVPQE